MTQLHTSSHIMDNSASWFQSLSRRIAIFVAGIGLLVLLGWLYDIAVLKSLMPGWTTMKSMTALLFVLTGISLRTRVRRVARLSAWIVILLSALTLGQYLLHVDVGIDQLVFTDDAAESLYPGRMSPATALGFLLAGFLLLSVHQAVESWFERYFIIAVFTISLLAVIGYLYEASSLYTIGAYSSMALHTAGTLLLLSLGILFARPERGLMSTILAETEGGYVLRRFLPMILTFPIALGWIRLMGQRMSLYDTAFGLAIMVIALIGSMTTFIWILSRQLTSMDAKRKRAESEILKLNADLEGKVVERTAELASANKSLQELSIVDQLTGLYNRRGLLLLAEEQFLLARRAKADVLVFYADLDGLKQINDLQGHDAGDKAIIDAALALRGTFRGSDIIARLGGDEFVVIIIEAEEPSVPSLLERLEQRLAERHLSMSVGVVSFDSQKDTSLDNLIADADQAMYEVKRNRSGRS